jgi:hypothetical protein
MQEWILVDFESDKDKGYKYTSKLKEYRQSSLEDLML